jgi:hypothetical protein
VFLFVLCTQRKRHKRYTGARVFRSPGPSAVSVLHQTVEIAGMSKASLRGTILIMAALVISARAFLSRSLSKQQRVASSTTKMATGGEAKKGKLLVLGGTGTTLHDVLKGRENSCCDLSWPCHSINVLTASLNCYKDSWARLSASELCWRDTKLPVSPGEGFHHLVAAHHHLRQILIIERETPGTN